MLSSTKLAISKWTPICGDEEDRTSARRERRASRSPGMMKGIGGRRGQEIQINMRYSPSCVLEGETCPVM